MFDSEREFASGHVDMWTPPFLRALTPPSPVPAKGGWLRERSAVPAFVLACAVLGHHHARHPHTFRPSYQALLGRLFDGDATPHRRLLS